MIFKVAVLMLTVFSLTSTPVNADVFAYRSNVAGRELSIQATTSYVSFLIQHNVFVSALRDPLTEQLIVFGATAPGAAQYQAELKRILQLSFDPVVQRARIRVTPVDRATGQPLLEAAFFLEAQYDEARGVFLPPLTEVARDN